MPDDRVIQKDMIIGEVMAKWPATIEVFKKHFGKGCFTCPGSDKEDIAFGAMMHNADLRIVLRELNEVAKKQDHG